MKLDRNGFLVMLQNGLWVVVQRDALAELESQEQRVTDFIPDVWRREVVNKAKDVGSYLFFVKLLAIRQGGHPVPLGYQSALLRSLEDLIGPIIEILL